MVISTAGLKCPQGIHYEPHLICMATCDSKDTANHSLNSLAGLSSVPELANSSSDCGMARFEGVIRDRSEIERYGPSRYLRAWNSKLWALKNLGSSPDDSCGTTFHPSIPLSLSFPFIQQLKLNIFISGENNWPRERWSVATTDYEPGICSLKLTLRRIL